MTTPPDELLPLPPIVEAEDAKCGLVTNEYAQSYARRYAHANCRPLREKVRALEGELAVANGLLSDFGFRANFIRNADECEARAEAAEAENAKLREALEKIAAIRPDAYSDAIHAVALARAAVFSAQKEKGGG